MQPKERVVLAGGGQLSPEVTGAALAHEAHRPRPDELQQDSGLLYSLLV